MRLQDIFPELMTETADTWEQRHAAFKRTQTKRTRTVGKLRAAEKQQHAQQRRAADQRSRMNDKLRTLRSQIAKPD